MVRQMLKVIKCGRDENDSDKKKPRISCEFQFFSCIHGMWIGQNNTPNVYLFHLQ